MPRRKLDEQEFRRIAESHGLSPSEVKSVVNSFFSVILRYSRSLPYDDERKIFSREAFDARTRAFSIPYVGRIGPSYSRYLKWRANEAKEQEQERRAGCRAGYTKDDVENIAREVLAGNPPPKRERKKISDEYVRVWFVSNGKRRLARQLIRK